jgi:hypothetical protein
MYLIEFDSGFKTFTCKPQIKIPNFLSGHPTIQSNQEDILKSIITSPAQYSRNCNTYVKVSVLIRPAGETVYTEYKFQNKIPN